MFQNKIILLCGVMIFAIGCADMSSPINDAELEAQIRANSDKSELYGSCWYACGEESFNGNCYCDLTCESYGDCCNDFYSYCDYLLYDPCDAKYCGETCTLCAPNDLVCLESDTIKYCHEDRTCQEEVPTCGTEEPQTVALELIGFVTGNQSSNQSSAMDSWETACTIWRDKMLYLTNGQLGTYSCNNPGDGNSSSFYYRYESNPTLTVYVNVMSQEELLPFLPEKAFGERTDRVDRAYSTWQVDCFQELDAYKEQYGKRFLAGTCNEPQDISYSSFYYLYEGDIKIWLDSDPMEEMGQEIELSGFVVGSRDDSVYDAMVSWESECNAWQDMIADTISDSSVLGEFRCNTRDDIDTSSYYYLFSSWPTVTVFTDYYGYEIIEPFVPEKAHGNQADSRNTAYRSWQQDCEQVLQDNKQLYGSRFIAGVCKEPRDINTSSFYYLYEGDVEIWLRPYEF